MATEKAVTYAKKWFYHMILSPLNGGSMQVYVLKKLPGSSGVLKHLISKYELFCQANACVYLLFKVEIGERSLLFHRQ